MTQRLTAAVLCVCALLALSEPLGAQQPAKPTTKKPAPKPAKTTKPAEKPRATAEAPKPSRVVGQCDFSRLAASPVAVLPARLLAFDDSLGWKNWLEKLPDHRKYLSTVDDELAFALRERGLRNWIYADQLLRAAKRNPDYVIDPLLINTEELRASTQRKDGALQQPMASQVRNLVALTEARLVLVPVEMHIDKVPGGGLGQLDLVVLDARSSWMECRGVVVGDTTRALSSAVAASVAGRLASLVVPPETKR